MADGTRHNPTRGSASESRYSLMEFMREFPDDAACLDHLWKARFAPDGEHAHCPRCDKTRSFKRYVTAQRRQSWTCSGCGLHLHPTAGTIFHKSSTSLQLWYYALYLITSTRCGISAKQLERELGVGYKTAWRMFNVIRNSLMAEPEIAPLSGAVEVDETYFNRSKRNRPGETRKRGRSPGARVVVGAVERHGRVVVRHVPRANDQALMGHIWNHVLPASMVYTDEHPSYFTVAQTGYTHKRIKHSARVYVEGDVHTQTIEGFWSLVKRGISGVYHSVSAKWLQSYLDEYAWRYNHRDKLNRNEGEAMFRLILARAALRR